MSKICLLFLILVSSSVEAIANPIGHVFEQPEVDTPAFQALSREEQDALLIESFNQKIAPSVIQQLNEDVQSTGAWFGVNLALMTFQLHRLKKVVQVNFIEKSKAEKTIFRSDAYQDFQRADPKPKKVSGPLAPIYEKNAGAWHERKKQFINDHFPKELVEKASVDFSRMDFLAYPPLLVLTSVNLVQNTRLFVKALWRRYKRMMDGPGIELQRKYVLVRRFFPKEHQDPLEMSLFDLNEHTTAAEIEDIQSVLDYFIELNEVEVFSLPV